MRFGVAGSTPRVVVPPIINSNGGRLAKKLAFFLSAPTVVQLAVAKVLQVWSDRTVRSSMVPYESHSHHE